MAFIIIQRSLIYYSFIIQTYSYLSIKFCHLDIFINSSQNILEHKYDFLLISLVLKLSLQYRIFNPLTISCDKLGEFKIFKNKQNSIRLFFNFK